MFEFVVNFLFNCKRFTTTVHFTLFDSDYNIISKTYVSTNYSRIKELISSHSDKFSSLRFISDKKILLGVVLNESD